MIMACWGKIWAVEAAILFVCVSGQLLPLPSIVPGKETRTPLTGGNVCSRLEIRYDSEDVTEPYDCWENVEVDSRHCQDHSTPGRRDCFWGWQRPRRHHRRRGRSSDRIKRDTGCYKLELRTCHRTLTKLVRKKETVKHCCDGYEPNGFGHCIAHDPCGLNNGACDHMCVQDYAGNSRCHCYPGYRLVDGTRCVDINECDESNPCNQKCFNTDGGFYCACNPGYNLINPHFCTETDECYLGNGGCQDECVNTQGAFYCLCDEGFDLEQGNKCIDNDECSLHNGGCSHTCLNQYGYYECLCPENMLLSANNKTCTDATGVSFPDLPRVPGAEASTQKGGGHMKIIAAVFGAIALIAIVVLGVCFRRRCSKSRDEAAPVMSRSPGSNASSHQYQDPIFVAGKKKEIESSGMGFDNPGYGEQEDLPPSYATVSETDPYTHLKPPKYEEKKPEEYTKLRDGQDPEPEKKSASSRDYDNACENTKKQSIMNLVENFEKKTTEVVKSKPVPKRSGSTASTSYDNVINEMKTKAYENE